MRILIHTMYFLPEMGSAPILMNELAASLAARGHEVEVVTTIPRPPHNRGYAGRFFVREQRDGYLVKRALTNFTAHHFGRLLAWSIYTLYTFWNLRKVRRGDIVFLRLPPLQLGVTGWLARRLRGAKAILNVQDIHPDLSIESGLLRNPFAIKAALIFEKMMYRVNERIAVISEGFKKNLMAKGVPGNKITIVPNWVDTEVLRPLPKDNAVSRKFGLDDKFVVMYSGIISISSYETLVHILEAARLLADSPDLRIVIVGEGFKGKDLKAKADALGLKNVLLLPFQPYADLPFMLAGADGLFVPLDKAKSFLSVPSKLYNYMAAGRPIIGLATEASEVAKIIREVRCGVFAPPDDAAAIAAAIRSLAVNRPEREAMGERSRTHVENFYGRAHVMDAWEDLIRRLERT
jgi:colanic acid biosynthesis glycosyl transferase WcaI